MKREYRSSTREEQARRTRSRIRRAARTLFSRNGVAGTTIAEIAAAAGVSAPTVYAAYESKAGIVLAMLEDMEEGAGIGPRLEAMFEEADSRRQLRLFVAAHTGLFREGSDVLKAALQAAEDPDVAGLVEKGDAQRRRVLDRLARGWQQAGVLRNGLTAADATERMWLLTTVESYLTAVDRLGWTPERYEEWLGDLLESQVLG
jgi:AcrR family transcriptional regulator